MNMQPAITRKQPDTIRAGAMRRPRIMPTLLMGTVCMPCTMRKTPPNITSKSTVPSRNQSA